MFLTILLEPLVSRAKALRLTLNLDFTVLKQHLQRFSKKPQRLMGTVHQIQKSVRWILFMETSL